MFPTGFASIRRNQYYDGRYVWRWYRNTGRFDFDFTPRFIASPIPLDMVGVARLANDDDAREEVALVDVTGDGLLDALWAEPGAKAWSVWAGNGHGAFLGNADGSGLRWSVPAGVDAVRAMAHYGFGISGAGVSDDYVTTSLFDVNGDGRPDLVTEDASALRVVAHLNDGQGFTPTAVLILPDEQRAMEHLHGVYVSAPADGTLYRRVQQRRLADLNGDGLHDRVEFTPTGPLENGTGTLRVYAGFGPTLSHSGATSIAVDSHLGIGAGAETSTIDLSWFTFGETVDFDGDGYDELVGGAQLFGLPLAAASEPPGLLTRIDGGRDASTTIRYASRTDTDVVTCTAAVTPQTPCTGIGAAPRRVVRDVTTWSEGREGPSVMSYRYQDPIVAADELGRHGFRGFARVQVTDPSHGEVAGVLRRATSLMDFSYAMDHRGQMVATRVLDEQQRLLSLAEYESYPFHLAGNGDLPTFLPMVEQRWTCVPRTGSLAVQEAACRRDTGLRTDHGWMALADHELTGFEWALLGQPGFDVTLWHENSTRSTGIGAAAGGPVRAVDTGRLLETNADHYLLLPTSSTTSEVVAGVTRQLAHQELEYEQAPLYLPSRTRVWLHDAVYAVSMESHDPGTGQLRWAQKPEQYRQAPNALEDDRVKASFAYDSFQIHVTRATNELGHTVWTTTDVGTGAPLTTRGPGSWTDPACTPSGCPVFEGAQTDIDGFGRPIRSWVIAQGATGGAGLKLTSTTTYMDAAGTGPRVETVRYQAFDDPSSTIRERIVLDGSGLVTAQTVLAGSAALDATTTFLYDAAGTLTLVTAPDPSNDAQLVMHRSDHDALGREVRRERPDGTAVTTTYEGVKVTRREVAAAGEPYPGQLAATIATVDAFGDLRTVAEQDAGAWPTTIYLHDGLGRVRTITDPDGNVTTLEHDGGGRRTAVTRGSIVWSYRYDHDGNQTVVVAPHLPAQDPSRFTSSTLYDPLGRPRSRVQGGRELTGAELADLGDGTTSWIYDQGPNGVGRPSSVTTAAGTTGAITRTFGYDLRGNLAHEEFGFSIWGGQFADTRRTDRVFDALGKVASVTNADGVVGDAATRIAYQYDRRGLPEHAHWMTAGGPVRLASLEWNRAGALVHRAHELHDQTWRHDRNGRLTNIRVSARTSPTDTFSTVNSQTLAYYAASDVRTLRTSTLVPEHEISVVDAWKFAYDQRHQLTSVEGPGYQGAFAYTPAGRLDAVAVDGPPALTRDVVYEYQDPVLGDPETLVSLSGPGQSYLYDWDRAGNQTRKRRTDQPSDWTFRYDGADELREARGTVNGAASRELYWYDATGQRVLALTMGDDGRPASLRLWFAGSEIHYGPNGAVTETQAYVDLGGPIGRIVDRGAAEFTFQNHLGHLLASIDAAGAPIAGFTYSPFGEVLRTIGPDADDFRRRFNGKEDDRATGLQYYGARYYDDVSFTWTQADPLYNVIPDGAGTQPRRANRYSFSLNNPLGYVDPDGRNPVWGALIGAGIGFVTEGASQLVSGDFNARRLAGSTLGGAFAGGVVAAQPNPAGGVMGGVGFVAIRDTLSAERSPPEVYIFSAATGAAMTPQITPRVSFSTAMPSALEAESIAASERAQQIHSELHPVAQDRRTTAVLTTNGPSIVATGSSRTLEPQQIDALRANEIPAILKNVHAEIQTMLDADALGLELHTLGSTRRFCPGCRAEIVRRGGEILSPRSAVFTYFGTRTK